MNATHDRCPSEPQDIPEFYEQYIHGYSSLLICIIGASGQFLNLVVFLRKEMINPTNILLAALAAAYLIMMLSYVPVIWYMFFHLNYFLHRERLSSPWLFLLVWQSDVFQIMNSYSSALSLIVGILRYLAVAHPFTYKHCDNIVFAKRIVVVCVILCILLRGPLIHSMQDGRMIDLEHSIKELSSCLRSMPINTNIYVISMRVREVLRPLILYIFVAYFLFHQATAGVLAVLNIRLIYILRKRYKGTPKSCKREEQTNRITKMLSVVLLLYILSELPQGLLFLVGFIREAPSEINDAMKMQNLIDLSIMAISSFDTIVYYFMYPHFRDSVHSLFARSVKNNIHVSTDIIESSM